MPLAANTAESQRQPALPSESELSFAQCPPPLLAVWARLTGKQQKDIQRHCETGFSLRTCLWGLPSAQPHFLWS